MEKVTGQKGLDLIFTAYRRVLSPALQVGFGVQCRYEESCSCYMQRALREHGFYKGLMIGAKRVLSCSRVRL